MSTQKIEDRNYKLKDVVAFGNWLLGNKNNPLVTDADLRNFFEEEEEEKEITARVKTYEDACRVLRIDPIDESKLKSFGFTPDEINMRKIKTITEALNEGWKPDWENSNQYKYYPYFRLSSGSFVFCDSYYDYSFAYAGYASRLCFKNSELAKYAGEQFQQLYSDYILYYQ